MYNLFSLCEDKHKFIFEVCPDLFGISLTIEELEYWIVYSLISSCKIENIDITGLSYNKANIKFKTYKLKQKERFNK